MNCSHCEKPVGDYPWSIHTPVENRVLCNIDCALLWLWCAIDPRDRGVLAGALIELLDDSKPAEV